MVHLLTFLGVTIILWFSFKKAIQRSIGDVSRGNVLLPEIFFKLIEMEAQCWGQSLKGPRPRSPGAGTWYLPGHNRPLSPSMREYLHNGKLKTKKLPRAWYSPLSGSDQIWCVWGRLVTHAHCTTDTQCTTQSWPSPSSTQNPTSSSKNWATLLKARLIAPFITASRRIKCFRANLTKEA